MIAQHTIVPVIITVQRLSLSSHINNGIIMAFGIADICVKDFAFSPSKFQHLNLYQKGDKSKFILEGCPLIT